MKEGIHPKYYQATVTCNCGNTFVTGSTKPEIHVEVCSACHSFYTGKEKTASLKGQIDKFNKKFGLAWFIRSWKHSPIPTPNGCPVWDFFIQLYRWPSTVIKVSLSCYWIHVFHRLHLGACNFIILMCFSSFWEVFTILIPVSGTGYEVVWEADVKTSRLT